MPTRRSRPSPWPSASTITNWRMRSIGQPALSQDHRPGRCRRGRIAYSGIAARAVLQAFPQADPERHVFVAQPPLFRIDVPAQGKNKPARKLYALEEQELAVLEEKLVDEGVREGAWTVSRFKGLGEMSPEQETTLNPDTRRVLPVGLEDGLEVSNDIFNMMMARESNLATARMDETVTWSKRTSPDIRWNGGWGPEAREQQINNRICSTTLRSSKDKQTCCGQAAGEARWFRRRRRAPPHFAPLSGEYGDSLPISRYASTHTCIRHCHGRIARCRA